MVTLYDFVSALGSTDIEHTLEIVILNKDYAETEKEEFVKIKTNISNICKYADWTVHSIYPEVCKDNVYLSCFIEQPKN